MAKLWPAQIAVQALKDEGVDTMFGLMGGHIQPIQDYAFREGIDVHQVRHEQAAAYAADGYARVSRKPGVCFGTAGPGMLNMVTGIHMAYLSRTPMVCLFGGHREKESHRGSLQEAYAGEVCRSLTKWTVRCTDPDKISYFIRKAFRDAMTPPAGPVGIELPIDTYNWNRVEQADQVSYLPGQWRRGRSPRPLAEPDMVEQAVDALLTAQRPLIIAGEGIYWSDGADSLKAVVEATRTPFNLRRLGRGAIPESHPLAVSAGARKDVLREADVVVLIGLQVGYFEGFGDWKSPAKFIQINANEQDILPALATDLEMIGDPGAIVEQMLNCLAGKRSVGLGREAWTQHVASVEMAFHDKLMAEAHSLSQDRPIHPRYLGNVVCDFLDPDTTVVLDSFTGSTFLTDQMRASKPGQILDAGLSAAFGHGIGMGIGAQVARPGKPVFVMMGDGGMGLGGGDIETAVRYRLPVVYMVYNDSTLCAGLERYCYGENFRVLGAKARTGFNLTQDVRYDRMYAPLGCHVEHVEEPADIRAALERSFESGKTAVINVIGTRHVRHPLYDSRNAKEMFWHLPEDEVEEPARRTHHQRFYPQYHPSET